MIHPIPKGYGYGFCMRLSSGQQLPDFFNNYKIEKKGPFVNALFTPDNWSWPVKEDNKGESYIIDGFSPNLNKQLHVGHLRNVVLANALHHLFPKAKFVAMLGKSLGEIPEAEKQLDKLWEDIDYTPTKYYDTELCKTVKPKFTLHDGEGAQKGCKVWRGPEGDVIVIKSNGEPTYAYHDLLLHQEVTPTHYITGQEQRDHFKSLGLADRHLSMGLVVGKDGKKIKSRDGSAKLISEIIADVVEVLDDRNTDVEKLAWNIIALNLLTVSCNQQVTYDPVAWCHTKNVGMAATYALARFHSIMTDMLVPYLDEGVCEEDMELLAWSEYLWYYVKMSRDRMSTTYLAEYICTLARKLNQLHASRKVVGGSNSLRLAVGRAFHSLKAAMQSLGLHILHHV